MRRRFAGGRAQRGSRPLAPMVAGALARVPAPGTLLTYGERASALRLRLSGRARRAQVCRLGRQHHRRRL